MKKGWKCFHHPTGPNNCWMKIQFPMWLMMAWDGLWWTVVSLPCPPLWPMWPLSPSLWFAHHLPSLHLLDNAPSCSCKSIDAVEKEAGSLQWSPVAGIARALSLASEAVSDANGSGVAMVVPYIGLVLRMDKTLIERGIKRCKKWPIYLYIYEWNCCQVSTN
jgi:hypothetical protein